MNYTPRQVAGWMHFVQRQQGRRRAENISNAALAHSGNSRRIRETINSALKDQ